MSSKKFFWAKTSVALFQVLKTVENIVKEAIKARVIDVKITWVITGVRFENVQIGHL